MNACRRAALTVCRYYLFCSAPVFDDFADIIRLWEGGVPGGLFTPSLVGTLSTNESKGLYAESIGYRNPKEPPRSVAE